MYQKGRGNLSAIYRQAALYPAALTFNVLHRLIPNYFTITKRSPTVCAAPGDSLACGVTGNLAGVQRQATAPLRHSRSAGRSSRGLLAQFLVYSGFASVFPGAPPFQSGLFPLGLAIAANYTTIIFLLFSISLGNVSPSPGSAGRRYFHSVFQRDSRL